MKKVVVLLIFVITVGSGLIFTVSQSTKAQAEYVPPTWGTSPAVAEFVSPTSSTTEHA